MNNQSWLVIPAEDPAYRLPDDLRRRDPFRGRDCGYVEQMRPFIRDFSAPGDTVLDPFCGFGTTLLAAALEGRAGIGFEADAQRREIAAERLARYDNRAQRVLHGSCLSLAPTLTSVDLVLTSVPYFGCRWPKDERDAGQFYSHHAYADFLDSFRELFVSLKSKLKPGGFIICMAENVRIGEQFVPLAWDIARLLAERFEMCDERVLVYERDAQPTTAPAIATNRAHEYALVARNRPRPIDIAATVECLQEFSARFTDAILFGGFAKHLSDANAPVPSDADVLVSANPDALATMTQWLEARAFNITRWGTAVHSTLIAAAAADSHYIRAERLLASGSRCVIDLYYGDAQWHARAMRSNETIRGIRLHRS